jgi:REP element-mobilizing transposase RayT
MMPRQARLDAPGTVHHVIIRGIEKRRIVGDDKDRDEFVLRMSRLAKDMQTVVYAWSLMSNHAHILLRSGPAGLARYMRRLLTGYAGYYNRRHARYGHLFQNRYKSIVCDEDVYLKELVRYIHLNPLRARLVGDVGELNSYRWCGTINLQGQDRNFVLSYFGHKEGPAKKAYRHYVSEGVAAGRKPELVGGGLVRSLGGWSEVKSLRKQGDNLLSDERILGSGDFVDRIIQEADNALRQQFSSRERTKKIETVVFAECKKGGIAVKELQAGGRRPNVSQVRKRIAEKLFKGSGIPLAEIARHTGVSTSAISKALAAT